MALVGEDAEEVEDLLGRPQIERARPERLPGDDVEAFENVQDDFVLRAEDFGRMKDGSCGLHARLLEVFAVVGGSAFTGKYRRPGCAARSVVRRPDLRPSGHAE
jgi:hypothetical protein